jgi:hypothetical protein
MKASAGRWSYRLDPAGFVKYSDAERYDKPLWEQPFYKELPTSLSAMFWDDLGFYSKEGLSTYYYYPPKRIPAPVRVAPFLLSLLLIPLFAWGAWLAVRKRELAGVSFLLSGFYLLAFWYYGLLATNDSVGIKAKYVIALLPMFLGVALRGFEGIEGVLGARGAMDAMDRLDRMDAFGLARSQGGWPARLRWICGGALGVFYAVLVVYDLFFALT